MCCPGECLYKWPNTGLYGGSPGALKRYLDDVKLPQTRTIAKRDRPNQATPGDAFGADALWRYLYKHRHKTPAEGSAAADVYFLGRDQCVSPTHSAPVNFRTRSTSRLAGARAFRSRPSPSASPSAQPREDPSSPSTATRTSSSPPGPSVFSRSREEPRSLAAAGSTSAPTQVLLPPQSRRVPSLLRAKRLRRLRDQQEHRTTDALPPLERPRQSPGRHLQIVPLERPRAPPARELLLDRLAKRRGLPRPRHAIRLPRGRWEHPSLKRRRGPSFLRARERTILSRRVGGRRRPASVLSLTKADDFSGHSKSSDDRMIH